jgi:hypothetical protein
VTSAAPGNFIYRYHNVGLFTPASFTNFRDGGFGIPPSPCSLLRRRIQDGYVNLLAAELPSLREIIHEDVDRLAFDAATLIGHGVDAGIRSRARNPNPGTDRKNTWIGGNGMASSGLLAL